MRMYPPSWLAFPLTLVALIPSPPSTVRLHSGLDPPAIHLQTRGVAIHQCFDDPVHSGSLEACLGPSATMRLLMCAILCFVCSLTLWTSTTQQVASSPPSSSLVQR